MGKLLRKQGLLHSIGRNVIGVTTLECKLAALSKADEEQCQWPNISVLHACALEKAAALFVEARKGGHNLNAYQGRMDKFIRAYYIGVRDNLDLHLSSWVNLRTRNIEYLVTKESCTSINTLWCQLWKFYKQLYLFISIYIYTNKT